MSYIVYDTSDDNYIVGAYATSALAVAQAATDSDYEAWAEDVDDDDLIESSHGPGLWGWAGIEGSTLTLLVEPPISDAEQQALDLRRGHQVYLDYRAKCRQTIWQSMGVGAAGGDTFGDLDKLRGQEEALIATDRWVLYHIALWDKLARNEWPTSFTGTATKEKCFQHIEKWCADPANVYIWYEVVKALHDEMPSNTDRRKWASEAIVGAVIYSDIITLGGVLREPDTAWYNPGPSAHANFDPEKLSLRSS